MRTKDNFFIRLIENFNLTVGVLNNFIGILNLLNLEQIR